MNVRTRPSLPALVSELARALTPVGGVVLLAIGFSGLLALGLGSALGKGFVAGDREGVTYTAERCADFFRFHPEAADCASAAAAHHFDEVVDTRAAAGVAGAAVLAGWYGLGRRFGRRSDSGALPRGFALTVGASLFGAAAVLQLGLFGLQAGFGQTTGTGALLSGGMVSLAAFLAYATRLVGDLLRDG